MTAPVFRVYSDSWYGRGRTPPPGLDVPMRVEVVGRASIERSTRIMLRRDAEVEVRRLRNMWLEEGVCLREDWPGWVEVYHPRCAQGVFGAVRVSPLDGPGPVTCLPDEDTAGGYVVGPLPGRVARRFAAEARAGGLEASTSPSETSEDAPGREWWLYVAPSGAVAGVGDGVRETVYAPDVDMADRGRLIRRQYAVFPTPEAALAAGWLGAEHGTWGSSPSKPSLSIDGWIGLTLDDDDELVRPTGAIAEAALEGADRLRQAGILSPSTLDVATQWEIGQRTHADLVDLPQDEHDAGLLVFSDEIRRQLHPDLVAEIARTGTVTRETHGHLRVLVEEQYGSGAPGWWRGEYLRGVQVRSGPGPELARKVPRRPLRAPDATSRCRSVWVESCPAEVLELQGDAAIHIWRDAHPTPESGLYGEAP